MTCLKPVNRGRNRYGVRVPGHKEAGTIGNSEP
jgi:hypothetical protein